MNTQELTNLIQTKIEAYNKCGCGLCKARIDELTDIQKILKNTIEATQ